MKEEISNFLNEERTSLEKAAQAWRLPYWDWALKKPDPQNPQKRDYNVPLVIRSTEVKIRRPLSPGLVPFPNAFYQFTMPGKIPMGDASLSNKDPLKDLAIKKIETNDGTIPVCLEILSSRKPLTFPSSTFAQQRADIQRRKTQKELRAGKLGNKTIKELSTTSEITNLTLRLALKNEAT